MISRRRIYWAGIALLTVVVCLLVRPIRTWVDRAAVDIATGGTASVDQLQLHFSESVVEARKFETHQSADGRRFGLVADKAWVALDPVDLVDRIYTSPTVLIEGAEVYLEDVQPDRMQPKPTSWEARLAQKLAGVSWEELCRHLQSVLTIDDPAGRLQTRITQLIQRSQEIVRQSREVTNDHQDRDNPLRYEDDVRRKLAKIDSLRSQQVELLKQFDATYQYLSAETKQLEQKYAAESQRIRSEALAAAAVEADMQGLADDVLVTSGTEAWKLYSPMAEIVYRLSQVAPAIEASDEAAPWNRSIRRSDLTLVSLPSIRAAGNFRLGKTVTPFHLAGSYSRRTETPGTSSWSCDFFKAERSVQVVVDELNETDSGSTLVSVTVWPQHGDPAGLATPKLLTAELRIEGGDVDGTIRVTQNVFDQVEFRREAQILSAALSRLGEPTEASEGTLPEIEYQLSGTWLSPVVTPSAPAERWLLDHIRQSLEPDLERALAQATVKLEASLQDQLTRLRASTRQVADASLLLRDVDQNPVYTARARLQGFLDELNGTAIRR